MPCLIRIYAFILAALPSLARASMLFGGFAQQHCYSSLDGWQNMGSSDSQTAGTCGGQCSDAGLPLFALSGTTCYCGSAYPSSSAQTNSGACSAPCEYYKSDTCGGPGAFVVYSINGKQASSAPASSAAPTSQSSSQASSSASSESSESSVTTASSSSATAAATPTSQSSTSSEPASSSTASDSTTASSATAPATSSSSASDQSSSASSAASSTSSAQTVTVTASSSTSAASTTSSERSTTSAAPSTTSAASTSSSASPSASRSSSTPTSTAASQINPHDKSAKDKHGISGGAIAGIVVGVVAGVVVIAGLLLLLCLRWRKRDREDEYYSPSASPDQLKSNIGSFHNPYPERPVVDQRLNPAMLGDPRISIASLADARDYSRQILKVANPDEKSII